MFSYIITIIVTIFIVSIVTEHMVIQRLQMSPGVEITNGRCRLKEPVETMCMRNGYFSVNEDKPVQKQNESEHQGAPVYFRNVMDHNEIHNNMYRPFVD